MIQNIKKILIVSLLIFFSTSIVLMVPTNVSAATVFQQCSNSARLQRSLVCQQTNSTTGSPNNNPVIGAIKIAINILSFITGATSVIIIIISGLRMTLNNGDANSAHKARNSILYAAIGIVITVTAQLIVVFILDHIS